MLQGAPIASLSKDAVSQGCLFGVFGYSCYGPYELGKAYNFPANLDGSGQTIVIFDAFGSPTIQADLTAFDQYFHVPDPPKFTIIDPGNHAPASPATLLGWQVETSLDVEYAHAMAPGANIVLAVSPTDDNRMMNRIEAQVLPRYPGAIVSQSFGSNESLARADIIDEATAHMIYAFGSMLGDTILASSGDSGATNGTSGVMASYPASDPLVTAVGGTQGLPYPGGLYDASTQTYGGEQVWNEPKFGIAAGGAPSILFRAPEYQRGVNGNRMRTTPDVSYNAAVDGGVEVFASPFIWLVGGTSAGSPMWASIFAIANQARAQAHRRGLGFANDKLYAIASNPRRYARDFHDITVGNNSLGGTEPGFSAGPGYDIASGLGSPNVANLVGDLARSDGGGDGQQGGGGDGQHGGDR